MTALLPDEGSRSGFKSASRECSIAGIPAKRLFSRAMHTHRGPKGCRTRQQDSQCKAKNGVGTARLPPHSLVVCSRISQLWPLNSACLSTPSSVASCPSALRLPFTLFAPPISDSTPLRHIRFIRRSSRIHYSLHPSNRRLPSNFRTRPARTSTPRSSAHVRRSRAHQPRNRPPPQSSTAMARAPSNITSPARHSHRHPDPQPPICPPTPHSQLPLAFRPRPSSTLRLPCASVCPHLTVLLQTAIPNRVRRDAQPRRLLVVLRHGPTLSCKPPKSRLRLRRELPLPFAILQWAPLRQSVRRGRAHAVAHDGLHKLGHPACESLVGDEFVGKEAASHDGIDVLAHI